MPKPLALLVYCTIIAAVLTYVLPAGQYDRRDDPATGRKVVVAGTYRQVQPQPVGPFQAIVAIPGGIIDAASVIAFVFIVGGAFAVVDKTGALRHGIDWLVIRLGDRGLWSVPIVCLAFAAGGVFENMQEEIIALIPPLLLLSRRLGFDALTTVLMSVGTAAVGSAFSPVNPFQVLIAQKVSHLPQGSATAYRTVLLVIALAIWIAAVTYRAHRTRQPVSVPTDAGDLTGRRPTVSAIIIGIVLVAFVIFVYGVVQFGWDFDSEAAVFFIMGIVVGLVGGLRVSGTADAFIEGFQSMTSAALMIGFARAISVVMERGQIIDTVVHGLSQPLATLPVGVAAISMMAVQVAIHIPVPSVSGQAVLTLPVLAPVSDLIHLQRQVTVLAYQYGAGLCDMLTPTNGGLLAVLAAAGVRYDQWFKAASRLVLGLAALGAVGILVAISVGVS